MKYPQKYKIKINLYIILRRCNKLKLGLKVSYLFLNWRAIVFVIIIIKANVNYNVIIC